MVSLAYFLNRNLTSLLKKSIPTFKQYCTLICFLLSLKTASNRQSVFKTQLPLKERIYYRHLRSPVDLCLSSTSHGYSVDIPIETHAKSKYQRSPSYTKSWLPKNIWPIQPQKYTKCVTFVAIRWLKTNQLS